MFHSSGGPVRQDISSSKTRLIGWFHKTPYEESHISSSQHAVLLSELRNIDKAHKPIIKNYFQIPHNNILRYDLQSQSPTIQNVGFFHQSC